MSIELLLDNSAFVRLTSPALAERRRAHEIADALSIDPEAGGKDVPVAGLLAWAVADQFGQ